MAEALLAGVPDPSQVLSRQHALDILHQHDLLYPQLAARILGCSVRTIYWRCQIGQLEADRRGPRKLLIRSASLLAWLEAHGY